MSTGRRSRKAKLAASDMFKRFARGEDLLVGSISKYSYSVGQKQGKEEPVKKKPTTSRTTPEKHVSSPSSLPKRGKGVSKWEPPIKPKSQSDGTGSKAADPVTNVPTTRMKKASKSLLKSKVIEQVADTGKQLCSKEGTVKCKRAKKHAYNDKEIRKPEMLSAEHSSDVCKSDAHKEASTAEAPSKPELHSPKKSTVRIVSVPLTEKISSLLTPKKRTEDNLWSHNKNFSLSPHVKVVSPPSASERPTDGTYTVSMLSNVAQHEGEIHIKEEENSATSDSQNWAVVSRLQLEEMQSSVAADSKCVSPSRRMSPSISQWRSAKQAKRVLECSGKALGEAVNETATKLAAHTFTKLKCAKVKPRRARSKRRRSSPLPYPSDTIQQDQFFHMFGLVKKSLLMKDASITNRLHREAGGKLRRVIKPCMKPEMVYRRLELARGCIIQGMHEKAEALDEWKSNLPLNATRVFMYDERRKRHEIHADSKVAVLAAEMPGGQRSKPSTPVRGNSGRASPATDTTLLKDNVPIGKSARKLCFDGLMESPKQQLKQYMKPKAKKRKHLTFDSDDAKAQRTESIPGCKVNSSSAVDLSVVLGIIKQEPGESIDAPSSPVGSRRSARRQGTKRKMWSHLLRAAPDEFIIDRHWEKEQQVKEERRQARMWRTTGDEGVGASQENSSNEDESSTRHSATGDLPADRDVASDVREGPTGDNTIIMSYPSPKICVKIEPRSDVERVASSVAFVDLTDVVVKKKKKKKKKKLATVCDDVPVSVIRPNVIGLDGQSLPVDKCQMLFEQLKPVLTDLVNSNSKIGEDVLFLPNSNKDNLECHETLPYVFSSSAGASPSGIWAGNERYPYTDHECTIPHMCMVCWINDHMYCKNMKRVARDLPPCGGCIHYIPCKHYRHLKDTHHYSRKRTQKFTPPSTSTSESTIKSASATSKASPKTPTDYHKTQLSADDLLCYEDMLESDSEPSSPDTPAGTEILKAQLKARACQIAQSLGVKRLSSVKEVSCVPEVLPAEDKYDGDHGGHVDVCEYAAEVILFSDVRFNYTPVHEPLLSSINPYAMPVAQPVRTDSGPKISKEACAKNIKMPGKFCIRVAHQGTPGIVTADGHQVIKVKVQRLEPKKLLLQATPSGAETDDSKMALELVPEEREICLPRNKGRDVADFDSDLLGGVIAQEAMKLVSSGNFRPQLLKLKFDENLPFSQVDVRTEDGSAEKARIRKRKAHRKPKEVDSRAAEMQKNAVGVPNVSWAIETLPEELLDAAIREEPIETRWPMTTGKETSSGERMNPRVMSKSHERARSAESTVSQRTPANERTKHGKVVDTGASDLLHKLSLIAAPKLPASEATRLVTEKPGANKQCRLDVNTVQRRERQISKKPAHISIGRLHKDWEHEDSTVTALQCETIIPEEEMSQPLNLSKDKCAKKKNEGTVEDTSILHDMADCCLRTTDQAIDLTTEKTTDLTVDLTTDITTDLTTDLPTDLTVDQTTNLTTEQINLVAPGDCEISAITIESAITDSAGTMYSAERTTDQQVVTTVDSDISSLDSGIASFDSAVSGVDYSADNPDTGVVRVESGNTDNSGSTEVSNVIECDTDRSAHCSADLNEASIMSAASSNSCTVYTQDGTTGGDVSDNCVADPANHMTLDEFLQSMVSVGVSNDEIASIRQQLTGFGENEMIELVTASPQPIVIDQVSATGQIDPQLTDPVSVTGTALDNLPNASTPAFIDNQKLSSTSDRCEPGASINTVVTYVGELSTSLCSKTETETSIVEGLAGDLAPFIACDGQVVHYDAQMTTLDEGVAFEEVPLTTVDETNLVFSSEKTCVFASDDLCHSVDLSSGMDETDMAQVAPQPLA